jgi:dipeptidyl aminopeptidase/acylaminoacyl peptidase
VEYENFQDAIRDSFGGTKAEVPQEYRQRSAEFYPERLTMPVGLAVSGKDTTVPPQSVLRLAEALKANHAKVLLVYQKRMPHATQYANARTILEFMLENARGRGKH